MRPIWQWFEEQSENGWLRVQRWWVILTRWNRLAIRWISVVVFGYPLAITLAALAGSHVLIGFLTLLPLLAALRVSWLITQRRHQGRLGAATAVVFGTTVTSDRGEGAGRIRRLAADVEDVAIEVLQNLRRVLLVYGGIGAYYFFTPTENIGGFALGIMILMLLMGGSVGESRGWRTAFFWLPLLVIIIITAVLFSKEPWYQRLTKDDAKAAPAVIGAEKEGRIVARVTLPADGSRSPAIDTNDRVRFPRKTCLWFRSDTSGTSVYEDDVGPILFEDLGGPKRAIYEFANPAGGEVRALVGDC